ncbi:glycosyltransferase family 2 protein [Salipiger mucosus]|uniref:Glycosyl transferase, group 2 family protein n=1 Tax=Salipiger mucosus DSM 16094 TaxID=1123237 RepID=S9QG75_9RHOB|nr:glycosyltransferase family 2 protein [Salipiger mucosus]EPX78872.1 Glycosyl transferase, group 2 family protein [Salipiger mucosus DSM 16094]
MSDPRPVFQTSRHAQAGLPRGRPLGSILMENGTIAPSQAALAVGEARHSGATLPRVLLAEALATPDEVLEAQALHYGALRLDRETAPPDPALATLMPPELCLRHAALPWMRMGDTLVIATAQPERFDAVIAALPEGCGRVAMALALESDIHDQIAARHGAELARAAETRVCAAESCRDMDRLTPGRAVLAVGIALAAVMTLFLQPALFFAGAACLAVATLLCAQVLKVAALVAGQRRPAPRDPPAEPPPVISLLVPLFREADIAGALMSRLARLDYPRARLDVLLILEARDDQTRAALAGARLPPWARVIEVPEGRVTTKPRALNYALRFARGRIVGVYDAEDSPAPDQLRRVAARFVRAPPTVACLQGVLDFYNPAANWLSRCFTIEYATWFRLILPGLARLGFVVPLGGTTVFFRREVLEELGGWDAHNVTEDADLGLRLARYGYRTELVPMVTREEANNRAWPWVRQRSRWLKGYMITWMVHMRRPRLLLRQLGPWKFLGVQLVYLAGVLQFLLAPVLWSFWLVLAGLPHPVEALASPAQVKTLALAFLGAEAISLIVAIAAVARSPHTGLLPFVPTLVLYFPLATLAAYKALFEVLTRPFFWDKTAHGCSAPDHADADLPADEA